MNYQTDQLDQFVEKRMITTRTNWPLKLINRGQNLCLHNCMFNFLCSKSAFWISLFKLENYGAIFRIPKSSFGPIFQTRFDTSSSYLSNKSDSYNTLNLSPLEYYFVYFFMLVHDTRTESRKVFNEQTNCIEIDSVYGDLLIDYLNFFLPLNKQEIELPSFDHIEQQHQSKLHFPASIEPVVHKYDYGQHRSLFKKCYKKPCLTQFDSDLTPTKASTDRTNTMKKIDTFIRLINEILVYPFTDQTNGEHSKLNGTICYSESMQYLTNLECVFTLSIVIRHSHYFSQAFSEQSPTPLSQLRHLIFRIYWRRSFYKYFKYNLEHWPFDSNIKWLVELWLIYIEQFQPDQSISSQFIFNNYLTISSIYQIIVKRFSLVDLTNYHNTQILINIMQKFSINKENIKLCDIKLYHMKHQYLNRLSKQELLRHSEEFKEVLSMFEELDESLPLLTTLNDIEHAKLIGHLFKVLSNAKHMLDENIHVSKNKNTLQWFKCLFVQQTDSKFNNMNEQNLFKSIKNIEHCLELIRMFYQDRINFEEYELKEEEQLVGLGSRKNGQIEDYETIDDKVIKLTPKGRFRVINRIRKANVEQAYDPESASIGDFENKFLVYVCQFLSDFVNDNFSQFIEKIYNRTDMFGIVAKKCLYLSKQDNFKPRLNLRYLASYKFIFYFFVYLLLLNLLTGYSFVILVPIVLFFYFLYFVLTY